MRLTVLYNPKAGARGWPRGAILERLRAAGHEPTLFSSKTGWRTALNEPTDAVVAAGGDGTVHKLARALAGGERPMAILPLGTANNVARSFGYVPGSDPFARTAYWGERERRLRIECARGDGGAWPLLEVVGAGAFAALLAGSRGKKRPFPLDTLIGDRRRLMDRILGGDPLDAEMAIDGESFRGRFVLLACMRTPSFGPALWLAPDQQPDAPDFTMIGVRNDQREAFAWWLATGEGDVGGFRLGSGTRMAMEARGRFHVDDTLLDGSARRRVEVGGGATGVRILT